MNMMDSRKFRRRRKPLKVDEPIEDDLAPIEPLESREERLARREAEAFDEAEQGADEQTHLDAVASAQRQVEEQDRADRQRLAEEEAETVRIAEAQARADAAEETRRNRLAAARAKRSEAQQQAELAQQAGAARAQQQSFDEQTRRQATPMPRAPAQRRDPWADIPMMSVDLNHLNRNRVITADRLNPAHTSFDVLRTRLMHALTEKGWKRVAITSPGKDCGKTFSTANLAVSLSRQENTRTLVMDFDMRRPSLHSVMGVESPGSLGDVLRGTLAPEDHFLRMGENHFNAGHNIAFSMNTVIEPYASELLQDPRTERALNHIEESFQPDVMLFDLPPALFYDDVMAFQPLLDGVLLVVGGGLTTEREIKEVERRLGKDTPLLGMVLNKAEGADADRYAY
ncbi:CpsD/CapB family tyrosine-protein kinase [Sagittula sp. NFXS13]|uniref:CpsD/CapB family tyrosine-protein kinase n=1 Tax=Sagittula sp. NFXS13 TaxID=2819095 RepID=UPI0032DF4D3A